MPSVTARSSAALPSVTHAQIDPTSICDLKCAYCVGRTWKPGHLTETNFSDFVGQLPGLRYVQLQGEGEPMLGRRFWEYLARLRAAGVAVGFITNGRHLTTENVARLRELEVQTITVSVDSIDAEMYRRLRGGDVRRVLEGVERLVAGKAISTDVFLAAVLTRSTFQSLADLCSYSTRVGLSPPSCQELQTAPSYVAAYRGVSLESDSLTDVQRSQMQEYLSWRRTERARLGLASYYESVMTAGTEAERCPFVERSMHLRYDGEVFPCCFIKETEHSLGSISHGLPSLESARDDFLRQIRRGETPEPCADCHVLGPRYR